MRRSLLISFDLNVTYTYFCIHIKVLLFITEGCVKQKNKRIFPILDRMKAIVGTTQLSEFLTPKDLIYFKNSMSEIPEATLKDF